MNKSESIAKLAGALAKFQGEVQNPKNTADNPFFKSKYAPLNDVLNLVRPVLAKYGLSILQFPTGNGSDISISTVLMHESGEWIEVDPLVLKAEKATAQGAGSAITYGRRYVVSAILGISSEDDDDGNHASDNKPQPQQRQQQRPQQQQKPQQPKPQQQTSKPPVIEPEIIEPKTNPKQKSFEPTAGDKELELMTAQEFDQTPPQPIPPNAQFVATRRALFAVMGELKMDEVAFKQLLSDPLLPEVASEFEFSTFEVKSMNDLSILSLEAQSALVKKANDYLKKQKGQSNLGQLVCADCHKPIAENVQSFSVSKFGRGLCMDCQKKARMGAKQ